MDFEQIHVERFNELGWKTKMWQQQQLLVNEEYTNTFIASTRSAEETEIKQRKIREMWSEVQQGAALRVCLQVVVARLPRSMVGES